MAGQYEFVDFAKEDASRQQAQTQAAKGAFEFGAEKKAYAEKQAESKGVAEILKGFVSDQQAPSTPAQKTDAGPGGYDPASGTTGEDRQQFASLKDQMANNQNQAKAYTQQAQLLNKLMLNAAKNNDPEGALKFRSELDGLQDKMMKTQGDQLKLAKDQYETMSQLGEGYLANPTDEQWYTTVKEAMRLGLPGAENLLAVPREKREAVAKSAKAQGLTANQSVNAEMKALSIKQRQDASDRRDELAKETLRFKERQQTDLQNYRGARLAFDKSKHTDSDSKKLFEITNKVVTADSQYISHLDAEHKGIQDAIQKLESGKQFGLDDTATASKLAQLRRDLADNEDEQEKSKESYRSHMADLESLKTGKQPEKTKPAFSRSDKYGFVKGANPQDIKEYQDMMKNAKTEAERIDIQKKAYEYGLVEKR
jgi:hypothetical protein